MCLPSRRRHWMVTRPRTKLPAGSSRMHYQQFDYSTSGTDDEMSNTVFLMPRNPPDADHVEPVARIFSSDTSISPTNYLPQLFPDREPARSPSPPLTVSEEEPSTSAPLLTNQSLTEFLSNYPI